MRDSLRVIWICNLILPEFADEYRVKKTAWEGWISGMLKLVKESGSVKLACCFPILDESRMKKGNLVEVSYYSFHALMDRNGMNNESYVTEFESIYRDFSPDIIHIWGSEYYHANIAMRAACSMGLENRVILHIQGIISAIVPYFNFGVDSKWLDYTCNEKNSMKDEAKKFQDRGISELEVFKSAKTLLGRTTWDNAYLSKVAPNSSYIKSGEVLRKEFYSSEPKWDVDECEKHSLLVSQAGYALKGVHLILPAIKALREEYSDLKLYIGGGGAIASGDVEKQTPYDRYMLFLINEYELNDCIVFTGMLDSANMKKQFLQTHIFVSASTIENSSNAIGEAQMLGVPVVATYTGGTPDLVEHGKTGLLYQMDADYMFANCIRRIFEDDDFAMQLSNEEQKIAADRYNPEKVSKELIEIYREIAGENHG